MNQLSRGRVVGKKIQPFTYSGNEITPSFRKHGLSGEPPVTGRGMGIWGETENKVDQSIPGDNPTDGVQLGGDENASLTIVEDANAPFSQTVWELDNSDGEDDAYVEFDGAVENSNVHSGSVYGKVISGAPKISLNYE